MQDRLRQLHVEFKMLEDLIAKGKTLKVEEKDDSDDEGAEMAEMMTVHCVTCGANVQTATAVRHMERCYNKVGLQSKSILG